MNKRFYVHFTSQMQWDPLASLSVTTEWPIDQVACSVNKLTGTVFLGVDAAFSVCSMLLCGWLLVLHYLSALAAGGRHCDVCCMCQSWALNLDPTSFCNAARQAGLGRGSGCILAGYFFSSLVSASSISFCVPLIIVPPLETHVFVSKRQRATFRTVALGLSFSLCRSDCVSINPQSHLVIILANIHHCLVSD